jgi:hypothetical protein
MAIKFKKKSTVDSYISNTNLPWKSLVVPEHNFGLESVVGLDELSDYEVNENTGQILRSIIEREKVEKDKKLKSLKKRRLKFTIVEENARMHDGFEKIYFNNSVTENTELSCINSTMFNDLHFQNEIEHG